MGLPEFPEAALFYDWILVDPKDSPYASFRFHYRAWKNLRLLSLASDGASWHTTLRQRASYWLDKRNEATLRPNTSAGNNRDSHEGSLDMPPTSSTNICNHGRVETVIPSSQASDHDTPGKLPNSHGVEAGSLVRDLRNISIYWPRGLGGAIPVFSSPCPTLSDIEEEAASQDEFEEEVAKRLVSPEICRRTRPLPEPPLSNKPLSGNGDSVAFIDPGERFHTILEEDEADSERESLQNSKSTLAKGVAKETSIPWDRRGT